MSGLQFIREEQAFMDSQVELWMDQLALDPELQVPHVVLNYYFHRSCDERSIERVVGESYDLDTVNYDDTVITPTVLVPRQRSAFGSRRPITPVSDEIDR